MAFHPPCYHPAMAFYMQYKFKGWMIRLRGGGGWGEGWRNSRAAWSFLVQSNFPCRNICGEIFCTNFFLLRKSFESMHEFFFWAPRSAWNAFFAIFSCMKFVSCTSTAPSPPPLTFVMAHFYQLLYQFCLCSCRDGLTILFLCEDGTNFTPKSEIL